MDSGRKPIAVCPECNRVKKNGEWVEYEKIKPILQKNKEKWLQLSIHCPRCERAEG